VFWIHASNAARFEQSFRDIADQVKIPDRRNPKMDIFKAVHDWLRDEKHGRWIVVLDNADDAQFLVESAPMRQSTQAGNVTTQPLFAYLPWSQNGSVLITTRNKSVALRLAEERNIIAVEPMDEVHAVDLLNRKLKDQNDAKDTVDAKDTAELAAVLEFMPLAIVQAAAYIRHRTPQYSVRQYLEKFRKNDRQKSRLLGDDTGQFRRDLDAKNSIIITWQISFDHVRQTRPSAADLLSLMSLFDRQGIPEGLLRDRSGAQNEDDEGSQHISDDNKREDSEDGASVSSMDDEFEDDILVLRDYSFVFGANNTTLEMHRLVQLATRKWLETHGQLERWKRQYVKNLCAAFPTGRYENWGVCQALFPHAKAALEQKPEGERALLQWASVLYKAASYAWTKGFISDAENMSTQSMKLKEKLLGQDNNETLTSMAMVALARKLAGRWTEAEELFMRVMETRKRVLGEEHPDTLASMINLASTYWNQGRWTEAEELDVRVIETGSRVLGEEHLDTLASITNLASTYRKQGRWTEAEELEVRVMETRKRVQGEEHPDTLTSMANLASTFWNQGRLTEAEELEVRAMETRKRVLGEEHPSTLTSMANLASTYGN
jgi:Tetratricopeptide repeat